MQLLREYNCPIKIQRKADHIKSYLEMITPSEINKNYIINSLGLDSSKTVLNIVNDKC